MVDTEEHVMSSKDGRNQNIGEDKSMVVTKVNIFYIFVHI